MIRILLAISFHAVIIALPLVDYLDCAFSRFSDNYNHNIYYSFDFSHFTSIFKLMSRAKREALVFTVNRPLTDCLVLRVFNSGHIDNGRIAGKS